MSTFFFSRKISLNIRSELNSELRELLKILIQRKPHYFGTLQVGKTDFQDTSVIELYVKGHDSKKKVSKIN